MAVVQCESCGGRGVGLVEQPHTQCAHCRRVGPPPTSAYGPVAQNVVLWQRYHLPHLRDGDSRVLSLPTGLSADTCVQLASERGYMATPTQRATCSCAIDGSLWVRLRGCSCPTETWIEYKRAEIS